MKITKNKYLFIAVAMVFTMGSCSEDFLEVEPKGTNLEANYYQNESQAFAGLVAVYDVMRQNSGGFENLITMMNAGSDDHYAGGGSSSDGAGIQGFSNYTINPNTMPRSFWSVPYQGIFRANILLQKLPNVPMPDATKARFAAESKALRAYYYFTLVNMFKNVPLILEPIPQSEIYNVLQANPQDVYAQIENDLLAAIQDLPSMVSPDDAGRFTKGAAQALLGKVYLYQNKKSEAAAQLEQVNGTPGGTSQYGYRLLDNYADLWVVSNKFNTESILEVTHTQLGGSGWGNWGQGSDEGNSVNVMVGPRGYSKIGNLAPALPSGWSFNPFTDDLFAAMANDPRLEATVLNLKQLAADDQASYIAGYQDTGYFLNKFTPRQQDVTTGTGDAVLNYRQDTYAIRLADTYLMEAEALGSGPRAQALLDAVRARVGLTPIPVNQTNIMNERRMELAGEGFRFFDLVRTGQAATKLASRGFVAGKNEIFPIPYQELENTKIVQNPNYIN